VKKSHLFLRSSFLIGKACLSIIVTAVLVLTFLSGIVGLIWLAIIGHGLWIVGGLALACVMPWVFTIAHLPALGLHIIAHTFAQRGSKASVPLSVFLDSLYNYALMAVWSFLVFHYFVHAAAQESAVPFLLFGYSIMMAPLSYMAMREPPDNIGTHMTVFFAQLCFLVLVLAFFFGESLIPRIHIIIILGLLFSLFVTGTVIADMAEEEVEKGHF